MFAGSKFNKNIDTWDVSNVENLDFIFSNSEYYLDLSNWKPYNLINVANIFNNSRAIAPYWAKYHNKDDRKKAIDTYWLNKELGQELVENNSLEKRIKI
jgi:hypothetical protein